MPRKAVDPDAYVERPAYPRAIKIGPFMWAVKPWDTRAANNSEAYGMCDKATQTLLIQEGMTLQWERHVVVHEVLHACYCVSGLRELDSVRDPEEATVALLAFTLLGVVQENPELMAYLNA